MSAIRLRAASSILSQSGHHGRPLAGSRSAVNSTKCGRGYARLLASSEGNSSTVQGRGSPLLAASEKPPEDRYRSPRSHTMTQMTALSTRLERRRAADTAPPEETPAPRIAAERLYFSEFRCRDQLLSGLTGKNALDFGQSPHRFVRFPLSDLHHSVHSGLLRNAGGT